jgi:nicotinamidase-related amidase
MSGDLRLLLQSQTLTTDPDGRQGWRVRQTPVTWPVARTALLLCDVWDRHWCQGAVVRLEAMIPRLQATVDAARERGVQVIHAPSDTMACYADSPARRRVLQVPAVAPPPDLAHDDPPLPIDDRDGGADTGETCPRRTWTRQHPGIGIDADRDAITDQGREAYALLAQQGRDRLLIAGVHTNMCVLNRTFAIKQMVRWGLQVALIRDLTDAMYNPACAPYVSHDEGTRLVVAYIEKHWCPSVDSGQLRF